VLVSGLGSAIGAGLVVVLLALAVVTLQWLAPPRKRPADLPPFEELRARYARWVHVDHVVGVLCTPLAIAGWFLALRTLGDRTRHADAVFEEVPGWVFWALPALFLGLITAAQLTALVMRGLMGAARRRELVCYLEEVYQLDYRRSMLVVATPILLCFVLYVAAFLDTYAYLDKDGLVVNEPLSLREVRRPYATVTSVRQSVLAEDMGTSLGYEVVFADGYRWDPHELRDPEPDKDAALIRYVCERTGLPLQVDKAR
jgi:hypothetical protein